MQGAVRGGSLEVAVCCTRDSDGLPAPHHYRDHSLSTSRVHRDRGAVGPSATVHTTPTDASGSAIMLVEWQERLGAEGSARCEDWLAHGWAWSRLPASS